MIPIHRRAFAAAGLLSALCCLPAAAASAAAAAAVNETGELWEVTTQMSMEGVPMAMPARTQRSCAPREWKEPPGARGQQKDCETLEFRTAGTTMFWKVRCAGPPVTTGEAEITRSSPDAYAGTMKMTSPEGVMTMKLNGRRIGECDAGESKRQSGELQARVEKAQRESAALQAESCKAAVASMSLEWLNRQAETCTDPALKASFCARLETEEGFELVAACGNSQGNGVDDEAAYCGKNVNDLTKHVCAAALERESLDFLSRCCPGEAQGIAQRECAGRDYTALQGSKYASFCVGFARKGLAGEAQGQATEKPESKTEKAKKALKGLWKR